MAHLEPGRQSPVSLNRDFCVLECVVVVEASLVETCCGPQHFVEALGRGTGLDGPDLGL